MQFNFDCLSGFREDVENNGHLHVININFLSFPASSFPLNDFLIQTHTRPNLPLP